MMELDLLTLLQHLSSPPVLVGSVLLDLVFSVVFCRSLFVLFLLAIVLSVLLLLAIVLFVLFLLAIVLSVLLRIADYYFGIQFLFITFILSCVLDLYFFLYNIRLFLYRIMAFWMQRTNWSFCTTASKTVQSSLARRLRLHTT